MSLENPNPVIHQARDPSDNRLEQLKKQLENLDFIESGYLDSADIDAEEIFDIIRNINDPEHPLTLEQLNVLQLHHIQVDNSKKHILVNFTPTIPHCSMATLIGLSVRVKLLRSLPMDYKVDIKITPGSHSSEDAVNKQLNDKERVAAAMENSYLLDVVNKCLANSD